MYLIKKKTRTIFISKAITLQHVTYGTILTQIQTFKYL